MKLSIRTRLFLTLSALLLFFVLMSLSLTRLGLEKYYMWQKEDLLIATSTAIDDLYRGNPSDIAIELKRAANALGAGIIISDRNGQLKYTSFGPFIHQSSPGNGPASFQFPPPPPHITKSRKTIDDRTVLEMQSDPDIKIDFMVIDRRLNNGDTLHMRQTVAPISESAAVASHFMVFTGLLSILAGCIWAFFFAKRFTLPIQNLNRLAQRMALLDFSQKASIERNDEIGALGQSINHLSDQLDTAISELNQKNRQLLADVEKERQLDKMRKDFISSVSHELKTPLSLILGYAEGLKENVAQDQQSKDYYCSIIMDEAGKMDRLVHDLLNLSQIESGGFQLNRETFNLEVLLGELAQKYQPILTDKGVVLDLQCSTDLFVSGDRLRIEQILSNYLNNAIEHATGEKKISLSVAAAEDPEHVRVTVFNSGFPIPQDSLEKIWTSFYKVDKSRTRARGGQGLGLSIVRAIQELHGNRYGVDNLESGVRFWFDIDKAKTI
ncbi:MAG: integral rane sensor signal transduction histidine kinase [Firmicutes bacterium]|nr:integral rane sensor signal transduction histidine kinase [Bacillota bacterium]